MKIKKKIFLTGLAILLVLITTVSTTFAWFSLNDAAWTDNFELEIHSVDQLFVKHKTGNFKQALSNSDIVAAINNDRTTDKINSLNDIALTSVHSTDGKSFLKLQPSYDELNRQSVSLVTADQNSYLSFTLVFKVEQADTTSNEHPNYNLKFLENEEAGGVKKTQFKSETQTINLLNTLISKLEGEKVAGQTIKVNPVNALRLSVNSKSVNDENYNLNYIYEMSDGNDLGSYAIHIDTWRNDLYYPELENSDYICLGNAAYTYYNNINNNSLKPLGYYEIGESNKDAVKYVEDLLNKVKYDFTDSIGMFKYDSTTKAYNEIEVNFGIWLEGYDADNLIGLDVSEISCLLSFTIEEVASNE